MTQNEIKKWRKERDAIVLTYDVEAFKEFYHKWQKKGVYNMPLPSDMVIEISLRKMVLAMADATDEQKMRARMWLIEHGMKPEI